MTVSLRDQRRARDKAVDVRDDEAESIPAAAVPAAQMLLQLQRAAGNHAATWFVERGRSVARMTPPADMVTAQAAHKQAEAEHLAQSRILKQCLTEGRQSSDPTLRNACEWIASGNSKLYAVTMTGDSDERVRHHGKDNNTRAYFPNVKDANEPGDIDAPSGGSYTWNDLDDQTHVTLREANISGWNTPTAIPTGIAITGIPGPAGRKGAASASKDAVFATIKHEVQHAADRSQDKFAWLSQETTIIGERLTAAQRLGAALAARQPLDENDLACVPPVLATAIRSVHAAMVSGVQAAPDDWATLKASLAQGIDLKDQLLSFSNLEHYKTEYRAYSYQGSYRALDNGQNHDTSVPGRFHVPGHHWTERQYAIFSHIFLNYKHTSEGWTTNAPVFGTGQKFREAVIAYRDPDTEGVNKLDSPRINAFYEQLCTVPAGTVDAHGQAVNNLLGTTRTLTRAEAIYVRNKPGAVRELTTVINARLQGPALKRVLSALDRAADV